MTDEYKVVYSPAALDDIRGIFSYIAYELLSGQVAKNQTNRIRNEIKKPDLFPEKHELVDWEPWASLGMRKMPVDHYVVFYLVDRENRTVTIVRIFYGGRDVENIIREGGINAGK